MEMQLGKTRLVFCPLRESTEYTVSANESFGSLAGKSVAMRRVFHLAETYSPTDTTILIEGETGTGKEITAEEIHKHSTRRNKPFIVIDCASLARDLIQSELFGHVKGAFTGAISDRKGAFEYADGGTVFLDEIGDLDLDLQPRLLRVIEKKEVKIVGSNKVKQIDVRIICATNRKLETEVNAERFREDLYYRLSVVRLELPPLRQRPQDIPLLASLFLKQFHGAEAAEALLEDEKTLDAFARHEWPGNVRELRNLMEIAPLRDGARLDLGSLLSLGRLPTETSSTFSFKADKPFKEAKNNLIAEFEKGYIRDLLKKNDGNVSRAAKEACIERAYLQRLIKKHGR
jgi:transcriptional regulator with PAS, ATPase and Fis domain